MSNKIAIIDYKMRNLRSVEKLGPECIITNDHDMIGNATKIVLPGVGVFKDTMKNLGRIGLAEPLNEEELITNKKYFLGICLGMQLFAKESYEFGETQELGWIDAQIVKFSQTNSKISHVGWNNVTFNIPSQLLEISFMKVIFILFTHITLNLMKILVSELVKTLLVQFKKKLFLQYNFI